MSYYVIDKVANKAYGPIETKREAEEHLGDAIDLAKKVIGAMSADVKFETTEKLDELEVKANGEIVSVYEIITEDQFDDPSQIPTKFE